MMACVVALRDDLAGAENPMALDVISELECDRLFLEHRAAFPVEALAPYAGRWIAWSPDGSRIVADSEAPEDLDERILAAGEDPERCVVEGIPATDAMLGGSGLGSMGS
jgi:hypothetical protein